jgi:hypothetical protein
MQGGHTARILQRATHTGYSLPGFEQYFQELSEGLAAAGDSAAAATRLRQTLSAKYDIEVLGPPRQANSAT